MLPSGGCIDILRVSSAWLKSFELRKLLCGVGHQGTLFEPGLLAFAKRLRKKRSHGGVSYTYLSFEDAPADDAK